MYELIKILCLKNKIKFDVSSFISPFQCGRNVLHYACFGGRLDTVRFLIENYDMDPDVDDEVSFTMALKYACILCFMFCCDLFIQYDCSCLQIAATMEQYDLLSYIGSKTECLFPTVIINEMFHSHSLLRYIHTEDNENRMIPESVSVTLYKSLFFFPLYNWFLTVRQESTNVCMYRRTLGSRAVLL
jgi:hypothetical protein